MTTINHGCWVTGADRVCEHGTKGCGHIHGQPAFHLDGEEAGVEAREENERREEFWRTQERVNASMRHQVCGDIEAGEMVAVCDCGAMRGSKRPHGFKATQSKSND